ncbi:hypothetical protein HMPREF1544_07008 [Mucor circinelloides 1006PhL]|uniref:Uncharacterized protein n=1 Tax=Mucor circinelloides f. circinelloides (strain 1006PhL) TaxID=1220926 RepID=S2J7S0_MUCC1|nr:hypothetical protein HMPREF1544_07008 [Mucor circinelloides 1006PhL]
MANHSPHPNSLSPHSKQPTSAFQWPIPPSPSHLKPNPQAMNDITVKEILERYNEDPELLKYILTAKTEEDKKKAAKDTLRAEEARIQLRHMDLELAREQSKASARFERPVYPPGYPQPYPHAVPAIHHQAQIVAHAPHPQHPYPYYSLAPVQQQVLARFNQPPQHVPGQQQPPASPSMPYPHSAHPLCPPPVDEKNFASRLPQFRQPSPSAAAALSEENRKRSRASISSPNEIEQDKLSHNKVMEALKAKIQRGTGGPPSPLTASPIRPPPSSSSAAAASSSSASSSQEHPNKKKKPTLPRPVVVHQVETASSPSPSPRSAKPVLPPIDTNLGRIDTVTKTTATTTRTVIKSDTESTNSATSSHSSGQQETAKNESTHQQKQKDAKSNMDINSTASPSDHILLNTRRARSLSPPSSSSSSSSSSSATANTNNTAATSKKIKS